MSWQQYVDEHLMCDIDGQGIHLTAAAIIGHDGSVWAQSSTFPAVLFTFSSRFFFIPYFHLFLDFVPFFCEHVIWELAMVFFFFFIWIMHVSIFLQINL